MRNKLKTNITFIIAFVLIVTIATLTIFLLKDLPTNKGEALPISSEDLQNTSLTTPTLPAEMPAEILYQHNIPKQSIQSEKYLYMQNICGVGNIYLNNILQTSKGNYAIVTSECKMGDIYSDVTCVGVAKFDALGNISNVFSIPTQNNTKYITSQITPFGITIITSDFDNKNFFINIIDENLQNICTTLLSGGKNAKILPTVNNFLILIESDAESILYRYDNATLNFQSFNLFRLIEYFDFNDYFLIFANTDAGYCALKLDSESLKITKEITIQNSVLNGVKPIIDGTAMSFIVIETSDAVYARKFDLNLNIAISEVQRLGKFMVKTVSSDNDSLLITATGSINGIIRLQSDLTQSFADNTTSFIAERIIDYIYYDNTHLFLSLDANNNLAILKINNNIISVDYLQFATDNSQFILNINKTLSIGYNTSFYDFTAVGIIGISLI